MTGRVRHLPAVWAVVLAVLLLGPALGPGYVLGYDLVWVPHLTLRGDFLGFATSLPRAVPSDAVVAVLDNLVPAQPLEKLALLLPLVAAGTGVARLVGGSTTARLTAVSLAVWNPFTAERLGMGHWTVLVGYGVLPWLALAGRVTRRTRRVPASAWVLTALGSLSASAGVVSAVTLLVSGWSSPRRLGRADLTLVACALAGNAPWLVAGLLHAGSATGDGASVFALHGEGHLPAPLAAFGLGGIWNAQVVPGSRTTFLSWVSLVLLLAMAAVGARTWARRPDSARLLVLWGIGFGIAVLTWLLPGTTDWLAVHVPGGGLLRDGTRTLGLCLPVYAGLPAVGVEVAANRVAHDEVEVRRLVAAAGALLPVLLLYDAAWGLSGDLRPADYPASWAAARSAGGLAGGDLLVLPLTAYRAPDWNHDRTVLDPLGRYLPPDYLAADALVVDGRTVPGEDPRVRDARRALALRTPESRTEALLGLGVQSVAIERDALGPPAPQLDATVVFDAPDLVVVRLPGDATGREIPAGHRVAMGVAWTAYVLALVGGLAGVVVEFVTLRRRRRRESPPRAADL
jgi:hypothetical protein